MFKRYTNEELLQQIKDFYAKHKRVPKASDLGNSFRQLAVRRFGSWHEAVRVTLGLETKWRSWTDEEILDVLRKKYETSGRFPDSQCLVQIRSSLKRLIQARFGGLCQALDKAVGTSPCTEILHAISRLTPQGCSAATTREIKSELQQRAITLSAHQVGIHLDDLRNLELVVGMRTSKVTLWHLTEQGKRKVLSALKEKNHG